jgi:hypothetical protein
MTISTRNAVILLAAVGAVIAAVSVLDSSAFYEWQQERMVKRVLAADPQELLDAGRAFIASRQGFTGKISPSSPDVPKAIRRLEPTLISVSTNSLGVDFSDVSNPFGIIIYAAGANPPAKPKSGIGPRKWIDGLWLYDDGQLENFGQQVGAANGSQPIRSGTNSTSSAAGSRRCPLRSIQVTIARVIFERT